MQDTDDFNEEFDLDTDVVIANILKSKAELSARKEDKSSAEIANIGTKTFNKSLRDKAIKFLKKIEEKLESLSNQEVAKLLLALIAMGLSIEDEEELEYWISMLEKEALRRVASYFASQEEVNNSGLARFAKHKTKFAKKAIEFSQEDLDSLVSIMGSINKIQQTKTPKDKDSVEYKKFLEKEKFFKKVEKLLKEERDKKAKENAQKQKTKTKVTQKEDVNKLLGNLKTKMTLAGVEANGDYWAQTISDFKSSSNKTEFVSGWAHDGRQETKQSEKVDSNKIKELRGIEESKEKSSENKGNENAQKSNSNSGNQNQGHSGGR